MTRPRLKRLLLASHVGLVALLAGLLLATGAGMFQASVRAQARAEVAQVALEAQRRLAETRRELDVVGGLLTSRPTLQGYLQRRQRTPAADFLEAFRSTARIDFIRVTVGPQLFAEVGTPPPDIEAHGLQFDTADDTAWIVDRQEIRFGMASALVVAATRLSGTTLTDAISDRAQVRLVAPASLSKDEPESPLRLSLRHALSTGIPETLGPGNGHGVVRIEPVRGLDDSIAALLVVEVPTEALRRQTLGWLGAFGLGSLGLGALAALLAFWLARRIAHPFSELARAAERLGAGDLATRVPTPQSDLAEPVALAQSLDAMRDQVRRLAAAEREQRAELDAILDSVNEGIVAVDSDRSIRYANRQFLQLVGLDEHEHVLGRFCGDVLAPESRDGARPCEAHCPLIEARRTGVASATERCLPKGVPRDLVIRSAAPSAGRQVAVVREETAEEAARSVRDAILANLSHEFQTPISAQIASIELLRDHVRAHGDPTTRRLVDSQYRGVLRLSQLVENLLESVRVESGEFVMRRVPVDLIAVVRDAIDLMRPLLEQRGQTVESTLPPSPRRLVGDPQRLQQVVVNLLANANKFAPDRSRIWVELVWGEGLVSLWIEDEGPGLPWPPSQRASNVFAPFRRSPKDEPSERGTGLGLAIVQSVVERHGGKVILAHPLHASGGRLGVALPLEDACAS